MAWSEVVLGPAEAVRGAVLAVAGLVEPISSGGSAGALAAVRRLDLIDM